VKHAQFKSGAQFGAWLGLTPKQRSMAARATWAPSPSYLRTLLIQGAKSVVNTATPAVIRSRAGSWHSRCDPVGRRPWWPWPTRTLAFSEASLALRVPGACFQHGAQSY
jgi:hypothetical protein